MNKDNIIVEDGKLVDFEQVFFDDFKTEYPLKKLREEQLQSRCKLCFDDDFDEIETVAGFDIAYPYNDWDESIGACVVYDYRTKEKVEQQTIKMKTLFPYIPTYLSFRESPFIESLFEKLKKKPSVLMIDGNGILHPYKYGIACHIGTRLDIPTIGVAKSMLCGNLDTKTGKLSVDETVVGYAYAATKQVKKPIYISPGHKISVDTAYILTKNLCTTKHPEPLKAAHNLATSLLKVRDLRT